MVIMLNETTHVPKGIRTVKTALLWSVMGM